MKKETRCVHSGTIADPLTGGVNSPIFSSSAFSYLDREQIAYPRYFNTPNQRAVVEKVSALEGAEDGVLFSSGMAAIPCTISHKSFRMRGSPPVSFILEMPKPMAILAMWTISSIVISSHTSR